MTNTFNLQKLQIILRAMKHINIIDVSINRIDPDEYAYASDTLNVMIKKWEAQGLNLWKRKLGVLFTDSSINSYSLGTNGAHATNSYNATTVLSNIAIGDTTINVTSSANMTTNDYIGIECDDGTRQWSTISSVPTSTSVIINNAMTVASSSTSNTIVSYTTQITRPIRILRGTIYDLSNNTEMMMESLNYDEYLNLPIKSTPGRPNNFYYDRLLQGTTPYTGQAYFFPNPNNVKYLFKFTYQESLADLVSDTDYSDFPQEWLAALEWNLACELAYHYGKYQELQVIQPKAQQELSYVQDFDSDDPSIRFRLL